MEEQYRRLLNMAMPAAVKVNTDNDHALTNACLPSWGGGIFTFNDWLREMWRRALIGYHANEEWKTWITRYHSIKGKDAMSKEERGYVLYMCFCSHPMHISYPSPSSPSPRITAPRTPSPHLVAQARGGGAG
jgi:hypothetical protein